MALIKSTAIPSGATDYELEQSLKFEDGDSATLSWTPASAGNRKTWTWSGWFKRGNVNSSSTRGVLFSSYNDGANYTYIGFDDGGGGNLFYGKVKQAMTFKTVLNDSELETLTKGSLNSFCINPISYKKALMPAGLFSSNISR